MTIWRLNENSGADSTLSEAFEKLAELIERIVNPPSDANVVPLRR